jgi:hypothetical protein
LTPVSGMGENTDREPRQTSQTPASSWLSWALRFIFVLWVLQLAWVAWQLREETGDLGRRLWRQSWGEAVRREDLFYRWLIEVQRLMPPEAVYLFLDNYEAGKEIEARYHLFPRTHLLRLPEAPPSLLFHTLRQHQVSHLLVRDAKRPPGPGLQAAVNLGAANRLDLPGLGLVFLVDPTLITGGFYD